MRISYVVMWSLFTTLFIVYLMAIKMVRGGPSASSNYITGSHYQQPHHSYHQSGLNINAHHPLQTRAAVHSMRSFGGNVDAFASSGLLQSAPSVSASTSPKGGGGKMVDFGYHHYAAMEGLLRLFADTYPHLCQLYSIGKSAQGRELWVLLVTKNPSEEPLLKPNFKYIGNMHGNEAVGREMLLHLVDDLVDGYNSGDPYVKHLVENTRMHIMPTMNPDGFESAVEGQCLGGTGRFNVRGIDLNRNFPDQFTMRREQEQEEVAAIRGWVDRIPFALSANLHGGALVASYPYDNTPTNMLSRWKLSSEASIAPDNDVFKHLAEVYSFNHLTMHKGLPCPDGSVESFVNGTTNGAKWYPLPGGMQDYNYVYGSCMEITLELSCCKYPPRGELPEFWRQNRGALLAYINEVHRGARGIVSDANTGVAIPNAVLKIKGRKIPFRASARGEFWRILMPGHYVLVVSAPGYNTKEENILVTDGQITYLDVKLFPEGSLPSAVGTNDHLFSADLFEGGKRQSAAVAAVQQQQQHHQSLGSVSGPAGVTWGSWPQAKKPPVQGTKIIYPQSVESGGGGGGSYSSYSSNRPSISHLFNSFTNRFGTGSWSKWG